ncbi:hypothetical protein Ancab_012247, partial [Ancistrocladus abbreviatus]
ITHIRIKRGVEDSWSWEWVKSGMYSVQLAYRKVEEVGNRDSEEVYRKVWNVMLPEVPQH